MTNTTGSSQFETAEQLGRFIDISPTPFHAVENMSAELRAAGFTQVDAEAVPTTGRCFVVHDGALVAWVDGRDPHKAPRFIAAHTDSPNLRIRPLPDYEAFGVDQLGVEVYGGALLNSWLDRDLGIAGRAAIKDGDTVVTQLFASSTPQLRVAQLAIHLDRNVNENGLVLDRQRHVTPIWGIHDGSAVTFREWVATELGLPSEDVLAWDASCFDFQPHGLVGRNSEFLTSGRLDNLTSCFAGMRAIVSVTDDNDRPAILMCFDHEEVGSVTSSGAASVLATNVLQARASGLGLSSQTWAETLRSSMLLSADMAHGIHPNYPERHEPNHRVALGSGPAIKYNVNERYATDSRTAGEFKVACDVAGVPYQEYSHRGDLACGSTIGPLLSSSLALRTVDIGAPQLSMHSAREMMACTDVDHLVDAMASWFTRAG